MWVRAGSRNTIIMVWTNTDQEEREREKGRERCGGRLRQTGIEIDTHRVRETDRQTYRQSVRGGRERQIETQF